MLKCSTCNSEQDSGKFCGGCGGNLVALESEQTIEQQVQNEQPEQSAPIQAAPVISTPNQAAATIESVPQQAQVDIKNELSLYWAYLLNLLKNPTQAFRSDEDHFLYGIINIALYVLTFSLSIYVLFNTIYKSTFGLLSNLGMFGDILGSLANAPKSLPFGNIVFQAGLKGVIFIAIGFISAFIFSKLITNHLSLKELIAQYGSVITPLIALNMLAILFGLLNSVTFTIVLIVISFILTIIIVPALIVFEKGTNPTILTQKVYYSLGASTIALFGAYLVIKSTLNGLLGGLTGFMDMVNNIF